MMDMFKNWLKNRQKAAEHPRPVNIQKTGAHAIAQPKRPVQDSDVPKPVVEESLDPPVVEDAGSGKSALIRNKYVREETGTHETLKILDDSLVDSGEEPGIDPYNTGGFDRSKNWNNRFRK